MGRILLYSTWGFVLNKRDDLSYLSLFSILIRMNRFEKPLIAVVNTVLPDRHKIITTALASDFLHEHMRQRTPLDPLIQDVLDGTLRLPIPEYVLSKKTPERDNTVAFERWGRLKPSLNALASVFISDIWGSFESERSALLQHGTDNMPTDMPQLREKILMVFQDALQSWMTLQELKNQELLKEPSTRTIAYRQFITLFNYGYRNSLIDRHDDPIDFIKRGMFTAAVTTWGAIDLVPRLARSQGIELTQKQAVETISGAYGPVISMLSSMHKDLTSRIRRTIAPKYDYQFNPDYFYLHKTAHGYSLRMNHGKLMRIRDEHGIPLIFSILHGPTTWCPAKYTIPGKENVINGFVHWNIAIAARNFAGITSLPSERD